MSLSVQETGRLKDPGGTPYNGLYGTAEGTLRPKGELFFFNIFFFFHIFLVLIIIFLSTIFILYQIPRKQDTS